MKKILCMGLVVAMLLLLASCSAGTPAVANQSFVFSECTSENADDGFYSDTNLAGSTKEAVLETIKNKLYYNGEEDGNAISFSDHLGLTGYSFNGKTVTVYSLNYHPMDNSGLSFSDNGYYCVEGNQIVLLQYSIDQDCLESKTFDLREEYSSFGDNYVRRTGNIQIEEMTYTDGVLTTVVKVTVTEDNSGVVTSANAEYTITWAKQ